MKEFAVRKIFDFIKLIESNNNREWFNENKNIYIEAKERFDEIVCFIGKEIEKFDPEFKYSTAKNYTFRIYRDVRFSKNKLPYKNHFGAFFSVGGRKSPLAGYYFHLQRGESFFGGGVYRPDKDSLKAIRQEIYYSYKKFEEILNDKEFKNIYPSLIDDKLKNGPKDFPKDSPAIELLKYKSFAVAHKLTDEEVMSSGAINNILRGFSVLKNMNDYLNDAIKLGD